MVCPGGGGRSQWGWLQECAGVQSHVWSRRARGLRAATQPLSRPRFPPLRRRPAGAAAQRDGRGHGSGGCGLQPHQLHRRPAFHALCEWGPGAGFLGGGGHAQLLSQPTAVVVACTGRLPAAQLLSSSAMLMQLGPLLADRCAPVLATNTRVAELIVRERRQHALAARRRPLPPEMYPPASHSTLETTIRDSSLTWSAS